MESTNIVIYDWVSITSKIHTPEQIVSLLGMEDVTWETIKGAHGYKDRLYYNCISIHYNGSPEMGVWLELSGQGCRCFETIGHGDYEWLLGYVLDHPDDMNITRLDIAYDDHSGILDINQITQDTLSVEYVSKANSWECVQSSKGMSVVIGSRQSPVLIRIYDKARERGLTDGTHWIRVELQLRDDRAKEFAKLRCAVGEAFAGVVLNYLRYVDPDDDDSNKWRWPLKDYWADMIGDACKISIFTKPGTEYNVLHCENFVFNQAGNAIDALLQIYDVDTFLKKLQERKARPNPKYKEMIHRYNMRLD